MWSSTAQRVSLYIRSQHLLSDGDSCLVALSGGADSVALLLLLGELGYRVEAAHCNFHLRGEEAERDEQFVRQLCESRAVPLHLAHFDTRQYAVLHHVSIEMAARQLRYRYFAQLRADLGLAAVCVAHHRDDSVETLLMNLIRGTGIHGLHGIRPKRDHIIRPLLCLSRSEIEDYLNFVHQDYVTDSTNLTADIVRNKIRLRVLPLLNEINPAASRNIQRTAENIAEAETVYDAAVAQYLERIVGTGENGEVKVNISDIRSEAVLFELLHPYGFNAVQIGEIYKQLAAPTGQCYQGDDCELLLDRGWLLIQPLQQPFKPMKLPEVGNYVVSASTTLKVELVEVQSGGEIPREQYCVGIDAADVSFPLLLRPVETGDRFQPLGMQGSKLVSDYLTDRKRTLFEKRRQLVVTDARGRILWLVGERIAHPFRITEDTRQMLRLHLLQSS
ncbi:MAG: tRNA lysidine(34) synthetase TilS [Prevotella sp.]|nr:tRNA lysidine(34) synthetase TilS [Prevotella sp.]